jgi:predicted Zn-dependent protease
LKKVLSEEFNASIVTAPSITQIPPQLFDKQRKQGKSNATLQWLSNQYKVDKLTTKILSICDFDADSDNLDYVFEVKFQG